MTNSFDELEQASCLFVIGSNTTVAHPMVEEHFIQWVAVVSEIVEGLHWFHPGEAPEAVFALAPGQQVKAVYEYCNLHGLWMA